VVIIKTYFLDMQIEKDDIVDRMIQSIKRRIHILRHGTPDTQKPPVSDTKMMESVEIESKIRESIKTRDERTSLNSTCEESEDSG
jgi:hypothetical protein